MSQTKNTDVSHGVLALLKPPGMTSHDVVAHVRHVLKTKRVGHTGTLDPAAAGVLLVCVGQATRLVEALQNGTKEYLAEATFGFETDTLDAVGRTLRERDATQINKEAIEAACVAFRGRIEQIPPMHSAIKISGQKLYEIARLGNDRAETEIAARPIEISVLEVTRFFAATRPRAFLRIECSSGTYIRSLVRDIGYALDNVATMTFLSRVRNNVFGLARVATLEEFEKAPALLSLPDILTRLYGSIRVDEESVHAFWQGKQLQLQRGEMEGDTSVWSNPEGDLIALATKNSDGFYRPQKVFDLRMG